MYVDEIALLEELVDRVGDQTADAEHGLEGVGSGSQMGHGAEVLQRVTLRLDGIVGRRGTLHSHGDGLDLKGLLGVRGHLDLALHDQGRADVDLCHLGKVIQSVGDHDLNGLEVGAVGQHDKTKGLGSSPVSYPTADLHVLARVGVHVAVEFPKR